MDISPVQTVASQGGNIQEKPNWLRLLQEWKALAWTVAAALMAALIQFFAHIAEDGRRAALGIYALDKQTVSTDYVMVGVMVMATLVLQVVGVVIMGVVLLAILREMARSLPRNIQHLLHTIPQRKEWGWALVAIAVLTSGYGAWELKDLLRTADGMVLKPANEVGTAWMRMSLDPQNDWYFIYEFQLVFVITTLIALSWRILTKFFRKTGERVLYGMWMLTQIFLLVGGFAFMHGVPLTFQPYPIVVFSNEEQLGKHVLAALIGSDDKMFAFLVLYTGDKPNEVPNPSKVILYKPRTEVKWITVVGQQPLYLMAHYRDLKTLVPVTPSNSAPTPEVSIPEKATPPK